MHEVLEDPLVEALVAPAQQRERRLGGQLGRQRVVEQPPARRQGDHPPRLPQRRGIDPVARPQRRLHDVDAQDHPRAAAERRVVDLAPTSAASTRAGRRTRTSGPAPARSRTCRCSRNHSNHCGKSVKTSMFTRPRTPCRRRSGAPRRRSSGSRRAPSGSGSAADLERLARGQGDHPRDDADLAIAVDHGQPTRSAAQYSSSSSDVRHQQSAPRSASASSRDEHPESRTIGRSAVPARRSISIRPPGDRHGGAERQRAGPQHVERPVEPVRPADHPGRDQLTRRCRRGRAGCP